MTQYRPIRSYKNYETTGAKEGYTPHPVGVLCCGSEPRKRLPRGTWGTGMAVTDKIRDRVSHALRANSKKVPWLEAVKVTSQVDKPFLFPGNPTWAAADHVGGNRRKAEGGRWHARSTDVTEARSTVTRNLRPSRTGSPNDRIFWSKIGPHLI